MKQKTILIYHNCICQIGGVETFLYNFCLNLRNYYNIKILYSSGDIVQLARLRKLVKLEVYNPNAIYECDIFLRNSVWGYVPNNIISKDNRYLEMRHANYKFLKDINQLNIQYHPMEKVNEIIGCGEFVSEMSRQVLYDNPTTIRNILAPKQKTHKILRLITFARLDSQKGWRKNANFSTDVKRCKNKVYMECIY